MDLATGAATPPTLSPELEAEIDRRTGTVARGGNALELFPSGSASYERRWALLDGATRSIDVATFSMKDDGTSRRLRDVLLAKVRQGVRARIILDDAAVVSTLSYGLVASLREGGVGVVEYNPLLRALRPVGEGHLLRRLARGLRLARKRRFHEKYLVVDGEHAIVGGNNWGDKYAYGGIRPEAWRDSDVYVAGPVVADVQRAFDRDFAAYRALRRLRAAGATADFDHPRVREALAGVAAAERARLRIREPGSERLRFVVHRPYDEGRLPLTEAYLLMFRSAQRSIWWGCHSIRPPRIVAETLAEAAARGVDVRLITNSRKASRGLMARGVLGYMYWRSSAHFHWLLDHGIRIFEWPPPSTFHSKNLVVDGAVASVGSYNVAPGSTFHHAEATVIAHGGALPGLVHDQFVRDFASCRQLRVEDVRRPASWKDPFAAKLEARNLLVPPDLRTPAVAFDLATGNYDPE